MVMAIYNTKHMSALGTSRSFTREELREAGREESFTYLIVLGPDLPIMDLSQQFRSIKRKFNIFVSLSKNIL